MGNKAKLLMIGNGPSAIARLLGNEIDAFDGKVVRFNDFRTSGYEDKIGSRTDIWVTTSPYNSHIKTKFQEVYVVTWATDRECASHMAVCDYFPGTPKMSSEVIDKTREIMQYNAPTSGAIAVQFFSDYDIYIYGFDFLMQKTHHYCDDFQPTNTHNPEKEWDYFNALIQQGKIKQFGYNPKKETMPLVRWPLACGKDDELSWYREAAHNAWYRWFGAMSRGKTVLDVGSGVGAGMEVLKEEGVKSVYGFEVDSRLKYDNLLIGPNLKGYPDNCVDVCTCVDVIEHCVNDLELMQDIKRIAREAVYVTTPNFTRSRCGNPCHCREYSMAQFMNMFKPTQIWSASPDGKVHRTKVLERLANNAVADYSPQGCMNQKVADPIIYKDGVVPITKRFNDTVDGMEWGHICGIFI